MILNFPPILYPAKDPLQILIVVIISLPTNYHLILLIYMIKHLSSGISI